MSSLTSDTVLCRTLVVPSPILILSLDSWLWITVTLLLLGIVGDCSRRTLYRLGVAPPLGPRLPSLTKFPLNFPVRSWTPDYWMVTQIITSYWTNSWQNHLITTTLRVMSLKILYPNLLNLCPSYLLSFPRKDYFPISYLLSSTLEVIKKIPPFIMTYKLSLP